VSWTTEKPTVEGWYWWWRDDHVRLVLAYEMERGSLAARGENFILSDLSEARWAGPLEPPP